LREQRECRIGKERADRIQTFQPDLGSDVAASGAVGRDGPGNRKSERTQQLIVDDLVVRQNARPVRVESRVDLGAGAPSDKARLVLKAQRILEQVQRIVITGAEPGAAEAQTENFRRLMRE